MRRVLAADERPLHWVGSSKRDFLSFPAAVKEDMGNALGIAQFAGTAPTAKPWKGLGPGVLEIVESYDGNAYRAVYTVEEEEIASGDLLIRIKVVVVAVGIRKEHDKNDVYRVAQRLVDMGLIETKDVEPEE